MGPGAKSTIYIQVGIFIKKQCTFKKCLIWFVSSIVTPVFKRNVVPIDVLVFSIGEIFPSDVTHPNLNQNKAKWVRRILIWKQ